MEPKIPCVARRARFTNRMISNSIAFIFGAESNPHLFEPFKQDPAFFYLTGYTEANSILCLAKNRDNQFTSIIFTEVRTALQEQWSGPQLKLTQIAQWLEIDAAFPRDEFALRLPELLRSRTHLYHAVGKHLTHDRLLLDALKATQQQHRRLPSSASHWIDWRHWISKWRLIKDIAEIQAMRSATQASINALIHAIRNLSRITHEYQVEALLRAHYHWNGNYRPAYPPIVGSGKNALILHYSANEAPLQAGELLLIDAACSCKGYAADLTRTVPINGRFSDAQKIIYEIVLSAQRAALQQVFPGSTWVEVEKAARYALIEGLVLAGVLHGELDALYKKNADKPYYPHTIGHWLGLEVHDASPYEILDGPIAFEPGMILTIEPGLYLNQEPHIPLRFRNIGVRIEDTVLVTPTGHEILSHELPKTIPDIEKLMNQPTSKDTQSLQERKTPSFN